MTTGIPTRETPFTVTDVAGEFKKQDVLPRFCPVDGTPLHVTGDQFVCEQGLHTWEDQLDGEEPPGYYSLHLVKVES